MPEVENRKWRRCRLRRHPRCRRLIWRNPCRANCAASAAWSAAADGDWNAASQRSLTLFNKYAGTQFDVKLASVDALDALKAKPGRVCPLVCNFGFKADGDQCVKITCRAGYRVGDDNECEKVSREEAGCHAGGYEEARPQTASRSEAAPTSRKPDHGPDLSAGVGRLSAGR